jgi:hypothetical protein
VVNISRGFERFFFPVRQLVIAYEFRRVQQNLSESCNVKSTARLTQTDVRLIGTYHYRWIAQTLSRQFRK